VLFDCVLLHGNANKVSRDHRARSSRAPRGARIAVRPSRSEHSGFHRGLSPSVSAAARPPCRAPVSRSQNGGAGRSGHTGPVTQSAEQRRSGDRDGPTPYPLELSYGPRRVSYDSWLKYFSRVNIRKIYAFVWTDQVTSQCPRVYSSSRGAAPRPPSSSYAGFALALYEAPQI
jgi:hypothetical protein